MRSKKLFVAFGIAALAVVAFAVAAALNPPDDPATGPTRSAMMSGASPTTTSTIPSTQDRWLQMEQTGELHDMLQRHQAMMQQMQASVSPQMLEIMRNDPMWQMLDSGELIKEMEEHQADINRMLAQKGP